MIVSLLSNTRGTWGAAECPVPRLQELRQVESGMEKVIMKDSGVNGHNVLWGEKNLTKAEQTIIFSISICSPSDQPSRLQRGYQYEEFI